MVTIQVHCARKTLAARRRFLCAEDPRAAATGQPAADRRGTLSQRGRRPCHLPPDGVSHGVDVRPAEAAAAEQHVPDERLDGRLAHQPDEEQLLDDLRADRAQRRQPEQQLAEPDRLVGVLRPAVLLQGALRLLLQRLDVRHVRQSARVCQQAYKHTREVSTRNEERVTCRGQSAGQFWCDNNFL